MHICHVALQGCLRLTDVAYGSTADTGGHIKYLLELVRASAADPAVTQIDIVTRGFVDAELGSDYSPDRGELSGKIRLVRLRDDEPGYLPKEDLWQQHEALCTAFLAFLRSGPLPDLVHAHYADAGVLAARAKAELGLPFVFTGHSLGAVKRQVSGDIVDPVLDRRIAIENAVLAKADGIVASSRDEAEAQYAHYPSASSGRIRVIPPGCDLGAFEEAKPSDRVTGEIARFLREPGKPIVLAIARPVRKKNLLGLVEAYAASPALQEAANLVIVAGCRTRLGELEPECREVMESLIRAVDAHDLYGKVAYPKSHLPADIPAYYALARESGGVFVNPALNEPFGLTLLEAAAARLPVVATDSGGPNDIVERCRNGILVCPTDRAAIADACLKIVTDRHTWMRYASAGIDAVRAYDWTAHRAVYHRWAAELVAPARSSPTPRRLLVCDIDNTLLGDGDAVSAFVAWQHAHGQDTVLGIATGRSFHSAQAILAAEGVPTPDVIISSVGTCIHWYDRTGRCFVEDRAWSERVGKQWDEVGLGALAREHGLQPQARLEQRPGKASFFRGNADLNGMRDALRAAGYPVEMVVSHDHYVDLLPKGIGKHAAVAHVVDQLGLEADRVIVAGDSGNDLTMLGRCAKPIVVANWSDGIGKDASLSHAYVSETSHAAGVLEGIEHYQKSGSW